MATSESSENPGRYLATLERLLAIKATAVKPALNEASDLIALVLGADKVDAFVYEERTHTLVAIGTSNTAMARQEVALGLDRLPLANGGRAVQVYQTGTPFRHGELDKDLEEIRGIRESLQVRSVLCVPLVVDSTRRGVLQVDSARPHAFTQHDHEFLSAVADWVGLILHRSELVERLTREAHGHARRVAAEEIVTIVAHDLRNYLSPLVTRVQVLRSVAERNGHPSYVAEADELAQRLQRFSGLLTDLLDVARLERGLFSPDRRPVDLGALVREAVQAMKSTTLGFQLRVVDGIVLEVDPNRIRQAVDNLLVNAARHAPGTDVTVAIQRVTHDAKDAVAISVEDCGPGIEPDLLPRLTEAFVRGSKGRGLGIGLYLVRGIVEAHDGTLEVESTLGSGSVFRIVLPSPAAPSPVGGAERCLAES